MCIAEAFPSVKGTKAAVQGLLRSCLEQWVPLSSFRLRKSFKRSTATGV